MTCSTLSAYRHADRVGSVISLIGGYALGARAGETGVFRIFTQMVTWYHAWLKGVPMGVSVMRPIRSR